jgi:uncharacterized protein YndB with AHSA1/START domain
MAHAETVKRATGKTPGQWYAALDRWGARGRPFREIAAWLVEEHGVSKWWAQKLIVEYEQDRGIRMPGARPDGTIEVSTSKTLAAPVDQVYAAFTDSRKRKRWLSSGSMSLEDSARDKAARFTWQDHETRVKVTFDAKGPAKSTVVVAHQKLKDSMRAQEMKQAWKERLEALQKYLKA